MLDYIINQSCDEKRVVDVVHVGQAQRYGKRIEMKTPWTHQDHAIAWTWNLRTTQALQNEKDLNHLHSFFINIKALYI